MAYYAKPNLTKIKMFSSNNIESMEDNINKFISDKLILNIMYQVSATADSLVHYYSAMVLYKDLERKEL